MSGNGLCDASNLVDLEEKTVASLVLDSHGDALWVGHSQVIANDLDICRAIQRSPASPVVLKFECETKKELTTRKRFTLTAKVSVEALELSKDWIVLVNICFGRLKPFLLKNFGFAGTKQINIWRLLTNLVERIFNRDDWSFIDETLVQVTEFFGGQPLISIRVGVLKVKVVLAILEEL